MHKQLEQISGWMRRRRVLLFVLIIAILLRSLTVYFFARQNNLLDEKFTHHLEQVHQKEIFEQLNASFSKVESAIRGYAIRGDKEFLKFYFPAIDSITALDKRFHALQQTDQNTAEASSFAKFDEWLAKDIVLLQRIKLLCDTGKLDEAKALIADDEDINQIEAIKNTCSDILASRIQESQQQFMKVNSSNNWLAYASFGTAVFFMLVVFYFLLMEIRHRKKIHNESRIREEFFHFTINSVNEGIITTGKQGEILYMNTAAEKLSGWNIDEARGHALEKVYDVVNEESGRAFENIVSRILKTGNTIEFENNTILRTKDGRQLIISNTGSPLFDAKGSISGTVLLFHDITYRKEEELRLVKATIQAQESERQQLGLELHDNINQILVGAMLSMGMTKDSTPEKVAGYVQKSRGYINDAIEEIRKLSHRLTPASFTGIFLRETFETLVNSFDLADSYKISFDFDEPEQGNINDDIRINLYRIAQEQLKNIIKYAAATSIKISLHVIGDSIQMAIADDGVGFDPNKARTGIGLSNIKKRAELFKGKFTLETAPGQGCRIMVEIPLKKDQSL